MNVRTDCICCPWYVFAQVKAEEVIHSLKLKKDSNQLHHPLSALQSKSRCSPRIPSLYPSLICCHSPLLRSLQAPSPSLFKQYSLSISLFACTLAFLAQCIFYSHIRPLLFSYFYLSISGPFTHTLFFLVAIFYLFFHSRTLSLSQSVGFSRGVGKVEKVTLEINGACISLASPLLQIGFLLSSSYTMHNSSVPRSLSLIFVALFLHPFSFSSFLSPLCLSLSRTFSMSSSSVADNK